MGEEQIEWTELLILLMLIIVGISGIVFYYAGVITSRETIPLLTMMMELVITQIVGVYMLYKIYSLLSKKAHK